MRAALYHRTSAGDADGPEAGITRLRAESARRGWDVVLEHVDQVDRRGDPWPARRQLADVLQAGTEGVDVLLVQSLHRLLRGPYDLVDHVQAWLRAGTHLVATDDTIQGLPLDTTHPTAGLRIRDAIALLSHLRTSARSEVGRATHALSTRPAPGRPRAIYNPLELDILYHDGLSVREAARRLDRRGAPISPSKVHQVWTARREAGILDEARRQKAIEARGGLPKGGGQRRRRRP